MRKKEKGFSSVTILIIIFFILALISAGSFYYLKYQGKLTSSSFPFMNTTLNNDVPTPNPADVSTSTDVSIMEKELDGTEIKSIDKDLEELESSASIL